MSILLTARRRLQHVLSQFLAVQLRRGAVLVGRHEDLSNLQDSTIPHQEVPVVRLQESRPSEAASLVPRFPWATPRKRREARCRRVVVLEHVAHHPPPPPPSNVPGMKVML